MSNPSSEAPPRDVALLFTAEEIARKVVSLADEIASAMADPFTAVVILKGAFMFGADLIRALSRRGRHPRVEFIRLGSYGDALQTSGTVSLRSGPPAGIEGRPVLIVDDVLDSGLTLLEAKRLIDDCGAGEVRTCVLVRKEGKQKSADACGFRRVHDRRPLRRRLRHRLRRELSRLAVSCDCRRRLGRDQREPVNVHQPAVGDLEMRDNRQGQEGERKERLPQATPHGAGRPSQGGQALADLPEGKIAHQPRQRQRQICQNLVPAHSNETTLHCDQPIDRESHVPVVVAHDDDVVAVVADARGKGAVSQAEALDESAADVAVGAVARQHADLEHILIRIHKPLTVAVRQR